MLEAPKKENGKYSVEELLRIVELLRSPGGCPWDRAQTHFTMEKPMIEEAYEVVDAIEKNDREKMVEELGDVLLQVLFHATIGKEDGEFDINDVSDRCARKMLERHPHIFGDQTAGTPGEALASWEQAKMKEKGFSTLSQDLEDIPQCFPALMRAQKVAKKIEKAGKGGNAVNFDPEGIDFGSEEEVGKLLYEICRRAVGEGVECELALKRETERVIDGQKGS
ncbi:MAG: MazG family protein [Clostridia bacterium]|nr:MazG family protein [Clostridia bacterium]